MLIARRLSRSQIPTGMYSPLIFFKYTTQTLVYNRNLNIDKNKNAMIVKTQKIELYLTSGSYKAVRERSD